MIKVNNTIDDKVVLKLVEEEKEEGLIATVETHKDTLLLGEVVDCGASGQMAPGDLVLFSAYGYEEKDGYIFTTREMIWCNVSLCKD